MLANAQLGYRPYCNVREDQRSDSGQAASQVDRIAARR
jgi:hypothetical protein